METSRDTLETLDSALTSLAATFAIATHCHYFLWLERFEEIEGYEDKEAIGIESSCSYYSYDIKPMNNVIDYLEKAWECLLESWKADMEDMKRAEREREEWERKARELSKRKRKK